MILQIGDQFDRYQIRAHIAQGGMSDIYRAYDLLSGREVVLKIPSKQALGDPTQQERFQRELEAMKLLKHPAIQKGVTSGEFNRIPYLVTELVRGKSMRQLIQERAPLASDEAITLIKKVAEGILHCHQNGVVHRDLKPENILITEEGQPVVLDFGLALTPKGRRVTFANLGTTAGTPDYMAPEQIEGVRGDQRTDQYAIGTILYELLCGITPFSGDNSLAVMAQHLKGEVPRLDKTQPTVTPQLAAIIATTLQRNPNDRYPDLGAFIEALNHPETVNLAVLNKPVSSIPFWRKETIGLLVITVFVMLMVILISFFTFGSVVR